MNHPNKKVAQINSSKRQRDQWQPTGPCRFHQLPQALVTDILFRLSPNTLFICRCVCKPWLLMISDPLFNRLRHSRSPIGILIQTYPHVPNWRLRKLYFTHIESAGPDLQLERMTFRPNLAYPSLPTQLIMSFNFETEKFEIVPPPAQFAVFERKDKLTRCSLGVLEGCLLLCGFVGYTTKFEMWIMRDYGIQESWTKTFVIESLYPRKSFPLGEQYRPIMFLSNGEILMSYVSDGIGDVVCYKPETKRYRATSIALTESEFVATGYSPSFVSLHHIAKGEEVNRIRNNENFNKLFTEGCSSDAGSGTSAHLCTNLNPDSCPPGAEEAPVTPNVTTSSATLDFTLRVGTTCAICAGQLGYVFRGKGFAMCQKCFDASSS